MGTAEATSREGAVGQLRIAVVLFMVSIALRALVGGAATRGCPKTLLLLLGAPIAACLGKASGGFIADRIGWMQAAALALVTSAPLIVWGAGQTTLLLVGLLLFQTTMPVTLIAVARAMPHARGMAFGLPCLALVLGALPGMFHGTEAIQQRPVLLGWVAVALLSLLAGLWLLGRTGRRSGALVREPCSIPHGTVTSCGASEALGRIA